MTLADVSLDDRYAKAKGRVLMSGTQALVRLPMLQHARDQAAGLNTACFISGYRGSPLGGARPGSCGRRGRFLEDNDIHFQPGVNEDLAATAVWGSQQVDLFADARYDGVFAMLVRQGARRRPLRRRVQARQHAPAPSRHGGVLVLAGDDHTCKSSTTRAPERVRLHRRHDPGAATRPASRSSSTRPATAGRCRATRGCWVGFKMHRRDGRQRRHGRASTRSASQIVAARRLRAAAGRPQHPLARRARSTRRSACTATSSMPRSPSPAPTGSTAW